MTTRLNPYVAAPEQMKMLIGYAVKVHETGLELSLAELVKIRASQINGCGVCLQMHTADARKRGETEERIYMLDAWRESSLYTDRERAALAWTDALTRLTDSHAPDAVYDGLQGVFTDEEIVKLTMMIVVINGFNRLGVGFRIPHAVSRAQAAA